MPTRGIIGTLSITITDGEGSYEIASLRSAVLRTDVEMLPALHPDVWRWKHFVPGAQSWRADSEVLQLIDSVTDLRQAYLARVEQLCMARTLVDVVFEAESGTQYSGQAYFDGFSLGGAFDAGYAGSFGMVGVGPLEVIDDPLAGFVFLGLSNNGVLDNTQAGIYSVDSEFNMDSFTLRLATASRPRVIVPLNSRRQLLYQLEGELNTIYRIGMSDFASPVQWLNVDPDDVEGFAINELDEEVIVTISDIDSGLQDRVIVYDYDGNLLRSTSNPPADVATGCPGVDSANRKLYLRHNPGVRAVSRFDLDTLEYLNAEGVHVYGGMGPIEYNSVNGRLYWYEGNAGYLNIHIKTPSGNSTGSDVVLFNPISGFTQMYYSKLHGELLVGSGVALRLPPTGAGVASTSILTGLAENPGCRGICVYEPAGGHTA